MIKNELKNVKSLEEYMNLFKEPERKLKKVLLTCLIFLTISIIILINKYIIFGV